MCVYRFLSARYGLEALRCRRLKISRITELNDPFEFLGVDLSDEKIRWALQQTKRQLSKTKGLLCFSKTWNNPVLWSHYAESHRGLCLGFEVPRDFVKEVRYVDERPAPPDVPDLKFMEEVLFSKFVHWHYEQEYRAFVPLNEHENSLYFMDFSDNLRLRCVIVGEQSTITRADISSALGDLSNEVEVFKARAAFRSFEIVRQKDESLWA